MNKLSFIELLLIGIGLSMDAFSVAICKGLSMKKINTKNMYIIALFFGGFQAIMPLIGWILGKQFESYITAFDHWIAFILLLIIGGKMIFEVIKDDNNNENEESDKLNLKELLLLAIATSIDALAVGITFAFLQVRILPSITIIGVTTFGFSLLGVIIGNKFGSKYKNKATLAGGIILVLIGIKILLEHLGILNI